jgi:hypothetical protein
MVIEHTSSTTLFLLNENIFKILHYQFSLALKTIENTQISLEYKFKLNYGQTNTKNKCLYYEPWTRSHFMSYSTDLHNFCRRYGMQINYNFIVLEWLSFSPSVSRKFEPGMWHETIFNLQIKKWQKCRISSYHKFASLAVLDNQLPLLFLVPTILAFRSNARNVIIFSSLPQLRKWLNSDSYAFNYLRLSWS